MVFGLGGQLMAYPFDIGKDRDIEKDRDFEKELADLKAELAAVKLKLAIIKILGSKEDD